jgi:hypothetical protein
MAIQKIISETLSPALTTTYNNVSSSFKKVLTSIKSLANKFFTGVANFFNSIQSTLKDPLGLSKIGFGC